ncbi:MAG: HAMP domain-containing histidine kinase [Sneathiella sp.]|nr:HAMP domain-containing histidine kinase [Sneathiella sp.]
MKSHKEAKRIVKMLWALIGLTLVTSLVVNLSMGWGILNQRDQLAEITSQKARFGEKSIEIRLLLGEVRAAVVDTLNPDETVSWLLGKIPIAEYREVVGELLSQLPENKSEIRQTLQSKGESFVNLLARVHLWRRKNDLLFDDISRERTLNDVRNRLYKIQSIIDGVVGRERIRSAMKIKEYRQAEPGDVDRLAREIVEIHISKIRGTQSNLIIDLTDIQRLVEVLAGEDQFDHLSDLKDNKLKPSLERLLRDLRSLSLVDGTGEIIVRKELNALQVALFGKGYITDDQHQTIYVGEGGLYSLRRDYLSLQLRKKQLLEEFETQIFDFELYWANFVQFEQNRQKELEVQLGDELSVTWLRVLLLSVFGTAIFLLLIRLVFSAIARQVDALADLRREAEASNKAKSNFLASMSHELRTPLNAIIGFSEVMSTKVLGPLNHKKYEEYADDIHLSGKHLLNIIDDILDISSIEADKFETDEKELDFTEALVESILMVKMQAKEAKVQIENGAGTGDVKLYGDVRLIKQIIVNLLSNAIKFTPRDGTVQISKKFTEEGDFQISVVDTGIGMDEEGVKTALTPFGMVKSAYEASNKGTGLGLPLASKMMEIHDGSIEISSQLGKGTRVNLLFPASRVLSVSPSR